MCKSDCFYARCVHHQIAHQNIFNMTQVWVHTGIPFKLIKKPFHDLVFIATTVLKPEWCLLKGTDGI